MSITRHSTSLTTKLKKYALKHSVDLIGVTSAKSFEVDGWAGPIVNPRSYLKNARSVVVFGYYQLDKQLIESSKTAQPRGRLIPGSKAFLSMDEYCSEVITKYLKEKGHNAVKRRLMDKISLKALAVKAGLGMYGKNSIVHFERFGSWVQLGCVITDAFFETEDRSYKLSDCGDCTKCIEACPTQAIEEPYRIVPSLCIAQLLDKGGFIPGNLREKVGNRLSGCEICQKVCPMNHGLTPRSQYPVEVDEIPDNPKLIPLLLGDEDYCKIVFPSIVLELMDIPTVRRNAALALGNTGNSMAVPALAQSLSDIDSKLRLYAAWALGRIGGKEAQVALSSSLCNEVDEEVKEEMRAALKIERG